jgi:hypothetical protein
MPGGALTRAVGLIEVGGSYVLADAVDADRRLLAAEGAARRRLSRGGLLPLYESGRITPAELRAGQDMAMLREMTARHMQGASLAARYGERGSPGGGDAVGGLPLRYADVYVPWSRWASAWPVAQCGTVSLTDFVLLVAEAGNTLRQARGITGVHEVRGLGLLRRGLHRYAALAGWADGDAPADISG